MDKADPILIKYKDENKIIITINRPTENKAFMMMTKCKKISDFDLEIAKFERKLLKNGCDPAFISFKLASEFGISSVSINKRLKKIEDFLIYQAYKLDL